MTKKIVPWRQEQIAKQIANTNALIRSNQHPSLTPTASCVCWFLFHNTVFSQTHRYTCWKPSKNNENTSNLHIINFLSREIQTSSTFQTIMSILSKHSFALPLFLIAAASNFNPVSAGTGIPFANKSDLETAVNTYCADATTVFTSYGWVVVPDHRVGCSSSIVWNLFDAQTPGRLR